LEITKIPSSLILIFFSKNSTGNSLVLTFSKTETRENKMPGNISCRIFDFYKSSFKILCGVIPEAMGIIGTMGSGHF
jgi:hypothetical protein